MISYRKNSDGSEITQAYLESLIENHRPGWLQRAKERTDNYRVAGKVTDTSHIWSEVKVVFMRFQGNKCAFCEREHEGETFGKGSLDIEHFRPKNNVRTWKRSMEFRDLGIPITISNENTGGYYLLAYNPMNYTIACGPCNQAIKSDIFPILGNYNTKMEDPVSESLTEEPLLIYPIGTIDQDCEELIEFEGAIPKTKHNQGKEFQRAITTIEFFSLSDANTRGILFRERCDLILVLGIVLFFNPIGEESTKSINNSINDKSKHANCARSFVRLFNADPIRAREIFDEALAFVRTYAPN